MADAWLAQCESVLRERRGAERQREAGAGPKHDLVFTDRLLVALVYLRTGLPHAALAALYGTARSTISRAIGEIRPLLAARGFAVPDRPGIRLRTLADVFAYAEAEGIRLRIDGAETQVRRPKANRPGRRAFVSGKKKQNTIKTTTISDGQGRLLWSGADRPGRMHDQTAMRTEGITEQLRLHPKATAEVDEGYRGLANESAPRRRSRRTTRRSASSTPGERSAGDSPRSGSVSSTPTPSCGSGARCSATPAGVTTTPRPIVRSLH
ncbi:transposase family protein [Streptomyces sp. NPDC000927]|uniref:transposase family protein n=1 Tax=Streptomyces sp. NPDC000927 TaxID=3154371 RepID=UPI0033278A68